MGGMWGSTRIGWILAANGPIPGLHSTELQAVPQCSLMENPSLTGIPLPYARPIDSGKLRPPRSAGRTIARERLNERLLEARRQRCVVLSGPAGCGKSTLLLSWRQQLLSLGFDVAWLTLTPDDNDLTRFLDCLLASIAEVAPPLIQEADFLEGCASDREAVERTVITLVRSVSRHPRDLVLMLDDMDHLTDSGIHEALQWLLDYAPPNLHLAFASRAVPPLSLARLRSQKEILELDLRDLRLTLEESEQFLKSQLGSIDAAEVRRMHDMTDGWAAGLQLLCASRKANRGGNAADQMELRDTRAFASFFEAEVLSFLSPDDLELLRHMAVCSRFCAPLCAALTGRPEALDEAAALITRLENANLFLIPMASAERQSWYRLHPLLRDTLLEHFAARHPTERQAVHVRAWIWMRDHDQLDEAIRHAVLGGESAAAAQLIVERAESLQVVGDLRTLVELMRLLPAEEIRKRIPLRVLAARMLLFARNFAACAEELERLECDVPESDTSTRFSLAIVGAVLAVQRDDTDSAFALLPRLLHPPKDANPLMIGGNLNVLSWLYMHRGEYELARRIQLERPPLHCNGVPLVGSAAGSLQGRCLVGLSLAMEGQMIQAERIYREVMYEAERHGKSCSEARHLAAALLGAVLYEFNEVEAARDLLERWVDIVERVSIPDSVLRVMVTLACTHWVAGNRMEAFACLERLEAYASKLGLDRLLAYSLLYRIHWHLQLGEQAEAEAKLARIHEIDTRNPDAEYSALKEVRIISEYAQVRIQDTSGDVLGAARRLEQLIALCERHGRQALVARMLMHCGVLYARAGRREAAHARVMEALRRGHRFGLLRSLLDTHPTAIDLIDEVARSESLDLVLSFYVERLQACRPTNTATAAQLKRLEKTAAGAEPLKERELEVLRLLAQALPNKKIARALGLSPETVKWYLSQIYSKLGVRSRDEAVAWMRDLETGR